MIDDNEMKIGRGPAGSVSALMIDCKVFWEYFQSHLARGVGAMCELVSQLVAQFDAQISRRIDRHSFWSLHLVDTTKLIMLPARKHREPAM